MSSPKTFTDEFLDAYLKFGLGSMNKSDVDALVMWLLDRHGYKTEPPLSPLSNQQVSELIRTPVTKVKKLRYEAALKFGGTFTKIDDQAKARLLASLSTITFEPDGDKACLIIEDTLAKNWLQGQLKMNRQIFDHPFNTEIVRVSSDALFSVLGSIFDEKSVNTLKDEYMNAKSIEDKESKIEKLKALGMTFAKSAAGAAGKGLWALTKPLLPGP